MRRAQRRQKRYIAVLWLAGLIFAFIFSALAVVRSVSVFLQARTAFRETASVDSAIAKREQEIIILEGQISKIKSGEGIEMEARGRLNLQKPDENVVIIIEDEKKENVADDGADRPWWKNLLGWIGIAL